VAGALLAACFFVASSVSSALIWIPLAVLAFLVLWLPAFFGIESRCPHCNGRFFFDGDSPRGALPVTLWRFFGTRACARCRVPFGIAKSAAADAVKGAAHAAALREAQGWRCACNMLNEGRRLACSRCWAPRPAR
jgi:hypothetical protein